MKVSIPLTVKEIMERIEGASYHIYVVGGAVRDSLIGRENDDFDLCTDMPLEEVQKLFPDFVIMRENDHRNTGILRINNIEIEISSIRGNSLQEDLSKRDFTMNAIACDKDGNIIDYFGGAEDIANRKISLVDKAGRGLEIDPIRILRALRFQGTLQFELEEETKEVLKQKRAFLKQSSPERVYKEFLKILETQDAAQIIRDNIEVFAEIVPEINEMMHFEQNNVYHIYDVLEHTLHVVDNTPNDPILRMAALFHDIGKPRTYSVDEKGVGHFLGHEAESSKIFLEFAERYRVDKKTTEIVQKLIRNHDRDLSMKRSKITRFLMEFGTEDLPRLFQLKEADIRAQNPMFYDRLDDLQSLKQRYDEVSHEDICLSVRDLKINGRALMDMGFYDKQIGFILKDVLEKVTDETIKNDESDIIDYISHAFR